MRWNGRSRRHQEAWFITLNQANTGAGFRIRYALLVPEKKDVSLQVSFTSSVPGRPGASVAIARDYAAGQLSWTDDPFWLEMGPSSMEPGRITGMLDAAGIAVAWELLYQKVTDPLLIVPEGEYHSSGKTWQILVPHPFMLLGGKIQVGDHRFLLNGDSGQQAHFWGDPYPEEWVWFHCSSFIDEAGEPVPAYITGLVTQARLAGRILRRPRSFGHLVWKERHVRIEPVGRWEDRRLGQWEWNGILGKERVSINISAGLQEAVVEEYRDPRDQISYCHHSERADCLLRFRPPGEPPREIRAVGSMHVEVGSRHHMPLVQRRLAYE